MVQTTGVGESIAEVGELLAWLGSTLRPSPSQTGVATCTPVICISTCQKKDPLHSSNDRPTTPFTPDILCRLWVSRHANKEQPKLAQGQCWHAMFRNQIVVAGFPTPRRSTPGTGLELPLGVMARLIDTQRVDIFGDKQFLKGFSSMLIPTEQDGDLILWHHICSKSGDRISYLNSDMEHLRDIKWSQLEQARHVVGWSSEIRWFAGKRMI